MNVLCCYADIENHPFAPETREAVANLWPDTHEFVNCQGRDTRYHETLERYWRENQAGGFVVIEQDVLPTQAVRDEFEACGEPWCSFVGELSVGFTPAWLGCIRFHADLLRAEPDLMTEAALDDTSGVPSRLWYRFDVRVDRVLRHRGYQPHVHGRVQHLSPVSRLADPDADYTRFLERLLPAYMPVRA